MPFCNALWCQFLTFLNGEQYIVPVGLLEIIKKNDNKSIDWPAPSKSGISVEIEFLNKIMLWAL